MSEYKSIIEFAEWLRERKGISIIEFAEEYRKEKEIEITKEQEEREKELKEKDKPEYEEEDIPDYVIDGYDWFRKKFPDWRSLPVTVLKQLTTQFFAVTQNSPDFAEMVYSKLYYQQRV